MRKMWLWPVLGLLLMGFLLIALQNQWDKAEPLANITIRDLMKDHMDPAADEIWNSVGTVIDESGVHEIFPKTAEDWQKLKAAAQKVAEFSDILSRPGIRAAKVGEKSYAPGIELEPEQVDEFIEKNRDGFTTIAKNLKDVANTIQVAAESKNVAPLMDLGERMQESCEACHSTFWYPRQARLKLNKWSPLGVSE